jgi:gamma-glutamyl phosphate reductase
MDPAANTDTEAKKTFSRNIDHSAVYIRLSGRFLHYRIGLAFFDRERFLLLGLYH